MIKFLIKSTNEFRLETMDDVEAFHKQLLKEAENDGYSLNSYSWTEKAVKESGEIVDTYYQVKTTFIFDNLKDPENNFVEPEYHQAGYDQDRDAENF